MLRVHVGRVELSYYCEDLLLVRRNADVSLLKSPSASFRAHPDNTAVYSWFTAHGCYRDIALMWLFCNRWGKVFLFTVCRWLLYDSTWRLQSNVLSEGVRSHPGSCSLSFPGMMVDDWGWWLLTCAVRLRPEGAGDFLVFVHPGLLILHFCSMAVALGTWSAAWGCVRRVTGSHDSSWEWDGRG